MLESSVSMGMIRWEPLWWVPSPGDALPVSHAGGLLSTSWPCLIGCPSTGGAQLQPASSPTSGLAQILQDTQYLSGF